MAWSAIGSIGAAVIGGGLSYLGQQDANEVNVELARERMAFQERMYKNRYQYTMEDMRSAGLNPIVMQAQPGQAPAGAQATVQNEFGQAGLIGANAVSNAVESYRRSAEGRKKERETEVLDETAKNIQADTALKEEQQIQVQRDVFLKEAQGHLARASRRLTDQKRRNEFIKEGMLRIEEGILKADEQISRATAKGMSHTEKIYSTETGAVLRWIQAFMNAFAGSPVRGTYLFKR